MRRTHELSSKQAVVVGGSIAGLCAARVLADHFDRVILYERDELPDQPVNRSAIPQGQHVHLLMARGAQELEELFPGLLHDMAASGVPVIRNRRELIHFDAAGHVLETGLDDKYVAYVPSRGHLEWQIRKRVSAMPGIEIVHRAVAHPQYDPAAERVTGVVLDDGDVTPADLVVDASGRGSRLPTWLQQWGFERPREDSVQVGVTYASHRVKIPDGMMPQKMVIVGATRNRPLGIGMLFHEDGIWMVTAFGVAKAEPPRDFAEVCALADELLPAEISAALRAGTPVGEMNVHRYPTSKWRRYERIDKFPTGILPFGDAIASLNPTFGQGVTMAALQAGNLRRALAEGMDNVMWRLAFRNAKTIWPVWMMNGAADHTEHGAQGDRPWWYRPAYELFTQFVAAAETDPVLAEWFLSRTSLLDSLYLVPTPRLIGRAMRNNVKQWVAGRKSRESEVDVLDTVPVTGTR
ncbi:FAD-dependent oxidoreductase [Mycolicibacterium septicum]|uniref:FAD-dependent oxidoreductase n=1 Tax=Mycolicibacterium septicum TaxID=98668 RepID=UPI00235F992F|nr:tryptophan 7-halogenase [Mycolicibacterium septicum]